MRNGANPTEAVQCSGEQAEMLAEARASVCGKLVNLIGRRVRDVACVLYPDMGPLEAEKHLLRNLRGDNHRKVGIHEIDTILTVLGREDEEAWLRFTMRRRGIRPPDVFDRDGEVERLIKENERLRKEAQEAKDALRQQALAFAERET